MKNHFFKFIENCTALYIDNVLTDDFCITYDEESPVFEANTIDNLNRGNMRDYYIEESDIENIKIVSNNWILTVDGHDITIKGLEGKEI